MLDKILSTFKNPPQVAVARHLSAEAEDRLRPLSLGTRPAIVCDANTRPLLKGEFSGALWLELAGTPKADMATVNTLQKETASYDFLIALGGGTISDLCKYASFLDKKPYVTLPTAPSMNGYLSANASITNDEGHKQTLTAQMPQAVLCDLDVLCAAPTRLIRSGLGDSLCRPTCQADWLLSHLLLDTPYDPLPFEWLAPYERDLFEHADALLRGDREIMQLLVTTLLVSGLGMVHAGGSYPASEAEHLIAHTMEMKHGSALPYTCHGEQIGVTTLTMARWQETLLASATLPELCAPSEEKSASNRITAYFGATLAASLLPEYEKKLTAMKKNNAAERLEQHWPEIAAKIQAATLPPSRLEAALQKAGAPVTPGALGWHGDDYEAALRHARFIRNRFTFLDMMP